MEHFLGWECVIDGMGAILDLIQAEKHPSLIKSRIARVGAAFLKARCWEGERQEGCVPSCNEVRPRRRMAVQTWTWAVQVRT